MVSTGTDTTSLAMKEGHGIRYAWFDYEQHKLLRVEDIVLYSFQVPYTAPPAQPIRRRPNPAAAATSPNGAKPPTPDSEGAAEG